MEDIGSVKRYIGEIFRELARELEKDELVREFVGRREDIKGFMSAQEKLLAGYLENWDNPSADFAHSFEELYDSFGLPYTLVAWSLERFGSKLMDRLLSEEYSKEFVLKMRSYISSLSDQVARIYLRRDARRLSELSGSPFGEKPLYNAHVNWLMDIVSSIESEDMSKFPLIGADECEFSRVMGFPESLFACVDTHMCGYISKLHDTLHDVAGAFYALYNRGLFTQAYVMFKELTEHTTKLLKTISELYFLAYSDPEANFFRLVQTLSSGDGYKYVSLLDVSRLGSINKAHGREVGDIVLREVYRRLREILKGDEERTLLVKGSTANFLMLNLSHSQSEIESLMDRFGKELKFRLNTEGVSVEVEVLIATLELEPYVQLTESDLREILSFLKEEAKTSSTRMSTCIGKERRQEILRHVNEKYRSIEKVRMKLEKGDIELVFHPIVECSQVNRLVGVEVLARLIDNGKLVPAGVFIDLIYELNLIERLDTLVLKKLREYRSILSGVGSVFLNVGSLSLNSKTYMEKLREFIIKSEGIDIVVELTEQQLLDNVEAVVSIAQIGKVAVAVDDFGTGYSSLKVVADLVERGVLKVIKIDGSLIKEMLSSRSTWKVVDMISALSKKLETRTVAEFVESQEDLSAVRSLGIDYCQGYYVAVPMAVHELAVWIKGLG